MSYSLQPNGLYSPWNSLGQNTGVGSLSLLQGIFLTQGSNPCLPLQADSLPAEPQGKPKNIGMGISLLQQIFLTEELNPGLLHCRQILYQLSYEGSPLFLKPTGLSLKCRSQFHNCSLKHILNIFILYSVSDNSKIWSLCVLCANSYPWYQAAWAFYNLRLWNPVFSCFICKHLWDLGWNLFIFLESLLLLLKMPEDNNNNLLFSVTYWHPIFCDPMNCSMPGFPVLHHLPESAPFMSIESVMPSISSSATLLLLHSIFPSIRVLFMSHPIPSDGQSIGVSAVASVLPMNIQELISFRMDWFNLLAVQGTLKSLLQNQNSKSSIWVHYELNTFLGDLGNIQVTWICTSKPFEEWLVIMNYQRNVPF